MTQFDIRIELSGTVEADDKTVAAQLAYDAAILSGLNIVEIEVEGDEPDRAAPD